VTTANESRFGCKSQLINARNDLRIDSVIDALVIERVNTLPEDNFCHFARESFQLGAGYAHMASTETLGDEAMTSDAAGNITISRSIVKTFFDSLPQNRHMSPETAEGHQTAIANLAARALLGEIYAPLHPTVDVYQFKAFIAFIEGYRLVTTQTQPAEESYRLTPV
jgi:hypothetical protein